MMKVFVFIFALLFSHISSADTQIDTTLASKHINSDNDYNEFNPGIGVRFLTREGKLGHGWTAGVYQNSIDNTSFYLMGVVQYTLVEKIDIGIQAGFVTGYNSLPGDILGGLLFFERPFGKLIGRMAFLPPFEDHSGVIGLQIGIPIE